MNQLAQKEESNDDLPTDPMIVNNKLKHSTYAPLFDGLNMREPYGLFLPVIRAFRCIVTLITAMAMDGKEFILLQLMLYLYLSFTVLVYVGHCRPFKGDFQFAIELVNEAMITTLSYFAIVQLSDSFNVQNGLCINLTIYFHIAINVIVIVGQTIKDIILKFKRWHF